MKICILGLSLSSAWGNGHATTYRSLCKGLHKAGHTVLFLEQDVEWYRSNRDFNKVDYAELEIYQELEDAYALIEKKGGDADAFIIGSYVQHASALLAYLKQKDVAVLFYDIDTPITLQALAEGSCAYLKVEDIHQYDIYLSFTGGGALTTLREDYKAQRAEAFYCSVDEEEYYPQEQDEQYLLGYLGTYSEDRQPTLQSHLLENAKDLSTENFIIAGPQFPKDIVWPENVDRITHLPPVEHRKFYNCQRFTLNVTRDAMKEVGYAPSVRLFEAAACGVAIISDVWDGLEELLEPRKEVLLASTGEEAKFYLRTIDKEEAKEIGDRARARILRDHTGSRRAEQLINYVRELTKKRPLFAKE